MPEMYNTCMGCHSSTFVVYLLSALRKTRPPQAHFCICYSPSKSQTFVCSLPVIFAFHLHVTPTIFLSTLHWSLTFFQNIPWTACWDGRDALIICHPPHGEWLVASFCCVYQKELHPILVLSCSFSWAGIVVIGYHRFVCLSPLSSVSIPIVVCYPVEELLNLTVVFLASIFPSTFRPWDSPLTIN